MRQLATFPNAEAAVVLELTEASLLNLSTTIHDLAAVVQEQRHPTDQAPEPVSFAELAAEAQLALRPELLAAQARLSFDFAGLPTLAYVRNSLRTVLFNLFSNALKYHQSGRPPHVQVLATPCSACRTMAWALT